MFREECKNKPTNNLGKFYLKRKKKKKERLLVVNLFV